VQDIGAFGKSGTKTIKDSALAESLDQLIVEMTRILKTES
jgi:hypothetical protein